jgi:hypothetical protein
MPCPYPQLTEHARAPLNKDERGLPQIQQILLNYARSPGTNPIILILVIRLVLSLAIFHALRVTNRVLILVDIVCAAFNAAIQFVI